MRILSSFLFLCSLPMAVFGQIQTNIGDFSVDMIDTTIENDGYMGPYFRYFIGNFYF
jgi:hypothetical protein